MTDHANTAPNTRTIAAVQDAEQSRFGILHLGGLVLAGALAVLPGLVAASGDSSETQETVEETEGMEEVQETPSGFEDAEEVEGDLAPDDTVEEGLDVDDVTEEADVPEEDANPNPVVPQGGVIPPASIKDEADQ